MRNELLKGLTEEQKKKVAECNNAEEILALAKAEGVALNDEQLEAVSGGGCESPKDHPFDDKPFDKDIFEEKNPNDKNKVPTKPTRDIIA